MKDLVEKFAKMSDNELEEFARLAVENGCATEIEFFLHQAQLELDELDRHILRKMKDDCRLSSLEISKHLCSNASS